MADLDYMPISALQHFLFCERQCALIHLEQQWAENKLTVCGAILHEKVDEGAEENRPDLVIARSVRLSSEKLRITGIADRVDFVSCSSCGVSLAGKNGHWYPIPVEYKHGVSKDEDWDRVQLCAQALCLEEMLNCPVQEGALFYWKVRRRERVEFSQELRSVTTEAIRRLCELFDRRVTPAPVPKEGCRNCSLKDICQPEKLSAMRARTHYENLFEPEET